MAERRGVVVSSFCRYCSSSCAALSPSPSLPPLYLRPPRRLSLSFRVPAAAFAPLTRACGRGGLVTFLMALGGPRRDKKGIESLSDTPPPVRFLYLDSFPPRAPLALPRRRFCFLPFQLGFCAHAALSGALGRAASRVGGVTCAHMFPPKSPSLAPTPLRVSDRPVLTAYVVKTRKSTRPRHHELSQAQNPRAF